MRPQSPGMALDPRRPKGESRERSMNWHTRAIVILIQMAWPQSTG